MRKQLARRPRRKIRWNRVFFLLFIVCLAVGGIINAAYQAVNQLLAAPVSADVKASPVAASDAVVNILVLGLDDGDFDVPDSPSRSDAMMLARVDLKQGTVHLLSIPRDSRVNIPGYKGLDKINNAYFFGGPDLAVRTVESFLHVDIPYYVTLNWQGFIQVVDILGGVNLYVEHDMAYEDPYADLTINLHKGYQHLDGEKAGEYVRFRHDELGDIGRVERQQKFMKALSEQFWQFRTVFKLPFLAAAVHRNIHSNMPISTFVRVANVVRSVKASGEFAADMLPGKFATIKNVSYWEPDQAQIKSVMERLFPNPPAAVGQN